MGSSRDPDSPAVAILVDTATGWGRRLIGGIQSYLHSHRPWRILIEPLGQQEAIRIPAGWNGDGIIARIATKSMAENLARFSVPVVNVSGIDVGADAPRVSMNYAAAAELAFEHFHVRGFRSFAYCGPPKLAYVEEHRRGFEAIASEHGHTCRIHRPRRGAQAARSWQDQLDELGDWLEGLPKPVGIFTWSTHYAHQLIESARLRRIDVPEDAAILGGDDDELLNEMTNPPLSGVVTPSEQIGYAAAALLDELMRGEPAPSAPIIFDPHGIETRQSTDTLAIDDRDVAAAVRFIRENCTDSIQVADVLRHVPVSRRSLERRFTRILGRSPLAEIRRLRLQKATQLLLATDLPIPEVAARSGFGTPQYLSRIFNSHYGMTPSQFRQQSPGG